MCSIYYVEIFLKNNLPIVNVTSTSGDCCVCESILLRSNVNVASFLRFEYLPTHHRHPLPTKGFYFIKKKSREMVVSSSYILQCSGAVRTLCILGMVLSWEGFHVELRYQLGLC